MTCELCGREFEPAKNRRIVCRECFEKVGIVPPQRLTLAERLWGRCYEKDGHWEYGVVDASGRVGRLLLDHRQQPAPFVALILRGRSRPDARHFARAMCGNALCVRPEHLDWVRAAERARPGWTIGLDPAVAVDILASDRVARAEYQRTYRRRLRMAGVRTMAELAERQAAERQAAYEAARGPVVPPASAEPRRPEIVPPAGGQAPAAVTVELTASSGALLDRLRGARIAPVD